CGRCVDACNVIQVNNAITHGYRGVMAKIVAMGDGTLERSECVFCGQCIQACPVAALMEKKSLYRIRPWEAHHVRTTCPYCGVGCQMDLHIKDDKIMKVTGVEDALPNLGRLCVKGRFGYDFLHSPERLTKPLIRENG
ncbi:MAG: 4Fe-4S dicluster domain-containing protein, partial [Desulfobacteraceae bacterium]|nr:4Fe-4S dicluster domain-containing protein [Desulfobacteraceae bacterium]